MFTSVSKKKKNIIKKHVQECVRSYDTGMLNLTINANLTMKWGLVDLYLAVTYRLDPMQSTFLCFIWLIVWCDHN